ncbi:class I glutamine amidotransferase-like protein [Xylariaceae sp. FL1272]|nr:class I glutamine amidotransferase-like protein [Xylariaceae sp. FL1272]
MPSIFERAGKPTSGQEGRHTVNVGVFIPADCQLLDAAGVDIFGSLSYEYLSVLDKLVPKPVIAVAPSVAIHYIGSVQKGEPIQMTANQTVVATNHFSDPEVAPGKLDVVYIPGPDPFAPFDEGGLDWLRQQAETEGTDILSVCTGIFLCGKAGLLKGREVCGPRGMQPLIEQMGFEPKAMRGHELRWIQDGNFWSSGGVTNGNDLVSAYCRANTKHFPRPLVEMVLEMLDVGDRPQRYLKGEIYPTF